MDESLKGLTAIAWSLYKDAKPAKHYQIMVLDTYAITVKVATGKPSYVHVENFGSADAARKFAVAVTQTKEKGGYSLSREPRCKMVDKGMRTNLNKMVGKPGPNEDLAKSVSHLLAQGDKLAA